MGHVSRTYISNFSINTCRFIGPMKKNFYSYSFSQNMKIIRKDFQLSEESAVIYPTWIRSPLIKLVSKAQSAWRNSFVLQSDALLDKIFRRTKFSADKIFRRTKFFGKVFGSNHYFRHFCPPKFCPIRYSARRGFHGIFKHPQQSQILSVPSFQFLASRFLSTRSSPRTQSTDWSHPATRDPLSRWGP